MIEQSKTQIENLKIYDSAERVGTRGPSNTVRSE